MGDVAGRNERVLVYLPQPGDTLAAVASRFLADNKLAWQIVQANPFEAGAATTAWEPIPGTPVVVPLVPVNVTGVSGQGYQTVPILCYHRFGVGATKMQIEPSRFEAQLEWLARNQYNVIRLADLVDFLAGRAPLPPRSVVITIDDGYESVYRFAYPALKKFGFSATLFVYTDFIGSRDGLSWGQLQEMAASGVIDIQSHSKTHRNLAERGAGEGDAAYRRNIETEVQQPRAVLERGLANTGARVRHFAFPYGDANELVLETLQRGSFDLGVTVNAGGNAFFSHALMLRRTMIFGDFDLDDFKARLQLRVARTRP